MDNDCLPLISVIIPTYNVSSFIECTLRSVLSQTYNNLEIIIIDDGSIDETCSKIKRFNSDKITIIKKEHTGNVGRNLNEGIKMAAGEYIAVLGSDDSWDEKKLEKQMRFINDYQLVCSNAKTINESGNIISKKYFEEIFDDFEIDLCKLLENNYIIASSVFGEKMVFLKYGGFEQELGIRGEDYYLWLNISKMHNILFLNEPLVNIRFNRSNLSWISNEERMNLLENTIKIRSRFLDGYNDKIKNSAIIGITKLLKELCAICYKEKNYEKALFFAKRLIHICPNKFSYLYIKIILFFAVVKIKTFLKEVLD
ncbi:MAG: glycosyltransferase [Bacteroidetes bacterium]|nr:glycosyltransferase [Bacteroidota bacterium]